MNAVHLAEQATLGALIGAVMAAGSVTDGKGTPRTARSILTSFQEKSGATICVHDLREYVKARVAAYKYPRVLWLVDEIPKGPTGKIQRRDVIIPTTEGK